MASSIFKFGNDTYYLSGININTIYFYPNKNLLIEKIEKVDFLNPDNKNKIKFLVGFTFNKKISKENVVKIYSSIADLISRYLTIFSEKSLDINVLEKQLSLTNDESLKYLELREKNYFINDEYLKEKNFDYKDYYTKAIDNITDLKIEDKNKLQNSINSNQFKNMKSKLETLLIEQLEKRVG